MKGLLFYDDIGAKRNEWFISRLIESANELGHELELVIFDGKLPSLARWDGCDFAIVRTIAPRLNEWIEGFNIPVFNNAKTSFTANNKYHTYLYAWQRRIPVMPTLQPSNFREIAMHLAPPYVLKTVDGHGGSEVFLVETEQKCQELLSIYDVKRIIVQKVCSEPGVDMRVYVMGGKILAAVKRTSDTDFRSNFSLGGRAQITETPEEVSDIVSRIAGDLECDFVGIDFIRHEGKWVLNEIEDVVGTRMLYSLTDIDAAKLYMEYIINKMKKKA